MIPKWISLMEGKLRLQWGPEQISGWLRRYHRDEAVSHESIDRHVWKDKRQGGDLYKELRHHGKKYNKRGSGKAGLGCIPERMDIAERGLQLWKRKVGLGDRYDDRKGT